VLFLHQKIHRPFKDSRRYVEGIENQLILRLNASELIEGTHESIGNHGEEVPYTCVNNINTKNTMR
jgi:hypothetical protein